MNIQELEHYNFKSLDGKNKRSTGSNCICFRDKSRNVLCRNCGHLMHGRLRVPCVEHPRIVFLMDHTSCVKCKAFDNMLKEIDCQPLNKRKPKRLQFGTSSRLTVKFDLNNNN